MGTHGTRGSGRALAGAAPLLVLLAPLLVGLLLMTVGVAAGGCASSTTTTQPAATVTVTTAPPASSTSESLPTYAEVVGTYPSGAPVVDFEAQFDEIMDYGDEGYYIPIQGEYKGMHIRGAFTVDLEGAYVGSPGVLWEYIDDTRMPGWPPGSPAWDWTKYEKVVVPLAKKNPAFSTLYYDTFNEMWGPRLISNTTGSIGGVQVQPGDKLTFDASQRLVKVSAWSTPESATSVAPTPTPSVTPTPIASDTPGNITGVNKGSLPVKYIGLFALYEGMSQAEIDAFKAYEMDIESHGSGAFTIKNVPPGTYVLINGFTTTKKPFRVLPGETVDIGTVHLDKP